MARQRKGTIEWVPATAAKPGHYKARITLSDGSRPWIHLDPGLSEEKARDRAGAFTEKAWKGNATFTPTRGVKAHKPADPQIGPLSKAWVELIEKDTEMAPATLSMHRGNVANHVVPGLGRLKPSDLSTGTLRRWIRELRSKLEPSTVRNTFNTLAKMLDNAMGEEWITLPANPARHPAVRDELPTVLAPEEVRHLSPAQASTLIRASADRGLRYLVAVTTGLRDGELSALRWENLDDELGVKVWRVSRNLAIVGPDGFASEKTTKTRAGKRLIPVHPLALAAVEAWKASGWKAKYRREPKPSDPVFPGRQGRAARPKSAQLMRDDLEAAGLPVTYKEQPFEFNDLRHSFSTWLASAGVAKELRDRLMGHAAGDVGNRHYTARDIGQLRDAVLKITLDLEGDHGHLSPPPEAPQSSAESSEKRLDPTGTEGNQQQNQPVGRLSSVVEQRFRKP